MADDLGPAVTLLQRKLDEQLQTVADTKRTINMLLKMSGQPALYDETENEHSGVVRNDQFYGKGVATAAAEYLAMRKQACQPDEILRALVSGGFDFDVVGWKEDDRLRSLAISLAKNTGATGKFHRLKNGAFGLRSSYDEEFLRKAAEAASDNQAHKVKKRRAKAKPAPKPQASRRAEPAAKPSLVKPSATAPKVNDRQATNQTVEKEEQTA